MRALTGRVCIRSPLRVKMIVGKYLHFRKQSTGQNYKFLTSLAMFSVVLRGAVRTHAFAPRSARYLASKVPPKAASFRDPPPPAPTATTSSLPSLDFDPAERSPHAETTERTGAKSSKDSLSSIERRKRYLARLSLGILAIALGVQVLYLGRDWEADELPNKTVDAPAGRWARTKSRFMDMFDVCRLGSPFLALVLMFVQYFNKPAWTELLPPPLPGPHQKPYTLVVSLDDLLITSTWDVSP